jgi:hypothetical protein
MQEPVTAFDVHKEQRYDDRFCNRDGERAMMTRE